MMEGALARECTIYASSPFLFIPRVETKEYFYKIIMLYLQDSLALRGSMGVRCVI